MEPDRDRAAPVPLEYETPRPRTAFIDSVLARMPVRPRRIVFTIGMWCACYGLAAAILGNSHDGEVYLGWGGVLLGLSIPLCRRN